MTMPLPLLVVTLLAAASAEAGVIGPAVEARNVPCPGIEADLAARIASGFPGLRDPKLFLEGAGPLHLRFEENGESVEWTTEFSRQDCAALPATVSLLLRGWLEPRWRQAETQNRESAPPAPVSAPLAAPRPAAPSPAAQPESVTERLSFLLGLGPSFQSDGAVLGLSVDLALGRVLGVELGGTHEFSAPYAGTLNLETTGLGAGLRARLEPLAGTTLEAVVGPSMMRERLSNSEYESYRWTPAARGVVRAGVSLLDGFDAVIAFEWLERMPAEKSLSTPARRQYLLFGLRYSPD